MFEHPLEAGRREGGGWRIREKKKEVRKGNSTGRSRKVREEREGQWCVDVQVSNGMIGGGNRGRRGGEGEEELRWNTEVNVR